MPNSFSAVKLILAESSVNLYWKGYQQASRVWKSDSPSAFFERATFEVMYGEDFPSTFTLSKNPKV